MVNERGLHNRRRAESSMRAYVDNWFSCPILRLGLLEVLAILLKLLGRSETCSFVLTVILVYGSICFIFLGVRASGLP